MDNVSCEIIKDLLPLYLDGVLSEESNKLVDEHLQLCIECKEYYNQLKESDITIKQTKSADDKAAIKRIRRKINTKQLLLGCITALVIASLCLGISYKINVIGFYVPYENSGVFVEDNILKSTKFYRTNTLFRSPDGTIGFMYLTATKHDLSQSIDPFNLIGIEGIEPGVQKDHDGTIIEEFGPMTALYYIPQRYVNSLKDHSYWPEGDEAEKLEELISNSTLIWAAE